MIRPRVGEAVGFVRTNGGMAVVRANGAPLSGALSRVSFLGNVDASSSKSIEPSRAGGSPLFFGRGRGKSYSVGECLCVDAGCVVRSRYLLQLRLSVLFLNLQEGVQDGCSIGSIQRVRILVVSGWVWL